MSIPVIVFLWKDTTNAYSVGERDFGKSLPIRMLLIIVGDGFLTVAGVAGIEPTIRESKSLALPLGYTPI